MDGFSRDVPMERNKGFYHVTFYPRNVPLGRPKM